MRTAAEISTTTMIVTLSHCVHWGMVKSLEMTLWSWCHAVWEIFTKIFHWLQSIRFQANNWWHNGIMVGTSNAAVKTRLSILCKGRENHMWYIIKHIIIDYRGGAEMEIFNPRIFVFSILHDHYALRCINCELLSMRPNNLCG